MPLFFRKKKKDRTPEAPVIEAVEEEKPQEEPETEPGTGIEAVPELRAGFLDEDSPFERQADTTLVPLREGMMEQHFYIHGEPFLGEKPLNGFHYYFDPQRGGHTASGICYVPDEYSLSGPKTVYCSIYGNMMKGLFNVQGEMRYFHPETFAMAESELVEVEGRRCYFDAFGVMHTGWLQNEEGRRFFQSDGTMATGLTELPDGSVLGFDENGYQLFGLHRIGEAERYFDRRSGQMMKGFQTLGTEDGGPRRVYFDETGAMVYGPRAIDGHWYYFDKNGSMIVNSVVRLGGETYYYEPDGRRFGGPVFLNGHWKYFDRETGAMATGFRELGLPDGYTQGSVVYYDENGSMQFGLQEIEGARMCFDPEDGHRLSGLVSLPETLGGPRIVYFDENGHMQTGPVDENGLHMFFDDDGTRVTSSLVNYNGKTYFYDADGNRHAGLKYIKPNWKYFDEFTGEMHTGLVPMLREGRDELFFFDMEGNMQYGPQEIEGRQYYFDEWDGHQRTGLIRTLSDQGLQLRAYGENDVMPAGMLEWEGKTYFVRPDGTVVTNTMLESDGNVYYFDANGHRFYGEIKLNGRWKYFDQETGIMHTGLTQVPGPAGPRTLLFSEQGDRLYGLQQMDGQIRCFDLASGEMKRGLVHLSADYGEEKTVYFEEDGAMRFEPIEIDGNRLEFDPHTGALIRSLPAGEGFAQNPGALEGAQRRENGRRLYRFLKDQGWRPGPIAALLAVLEPRTGLNPGWQSGGQFGLFALPVSDGDWLKSQGYETTDGTAQLSRFLNEAGARWQKHGEIPLSFAEFTQAGFKPEALADAFAHGWLREEAPADAGRQARIWQRWLVENEEDLV